MTAVNVPHSIAISRPVVARIERALAKQGRELRSRQPFKRHTRKYLIVDVQQQIIVASYDDLVTLGRDLGCLEPWEELAAPLANSSRCSNHAQAAQRLIDSPAHIVVAIAPGL
jgi:hypothetical protein